MIYKVDWDKYTIYNVTEYLYRNMLMINEEGHDYLYNNILHFVNNDYVEKSL